MRPLLPLVVFLTIGSGLAACAATPGPSDSAPAGDPSVGQDGMLDTARGKVHGATEWVARGLDGLFGDVAPADPPRLTSGRLGLRVQWRQDEGWDVIGRFNVRLDLRNLREQAYLLVGRENERELVTDKPDAFSRQAQLLQEDRSDQSLFVGLGLRLRDAIDLRIGVRSLYKVYAQGRFVHLWQFGDRDRLEFRETVFWTADDGIGSTTVLTYDHAFASSLALRWLTSGTVSQENRGLSWSSSLGLFKGFGADRLLSFELLVNGEPGSVDVTEFGVRARWEQPVHRDWLLGELVFGHFWPRKDAVTERGRSWAIGAGLLMRF
jgi:hypothetical protein